MNCSMKISKMMTLLLVLFTMTFSVGYAEATSKVVGYVKTTANLNLREKATVSSKRLSVIPKGKELAYYSKKTISGSTWYQVQYNKQSGWVLGKYVKTVSGSTEVQDTKAKSIAVKDGNKTMTLYPAEKIDWNTGGIQDMIRRQTCFKIYDVKHGRIWTAYRQAGGEHMDIEPATAADTKVLCEIYGVSSAKEIADQNLWRRQPCLITVNGHTYACSLYGVPHGSDTISGNNMDGQVCLHFTNSKTHGSKKVDGYHKEAIEYAWKNAPSGHR